ncbi:MAG: formylglycine-generating enzyme family protein [Prevotella sp.]
MKTPIILILPCIILLNTMCQTDNSTIRRGKTEQNNETVKANTRLTTHKPSVAASQHKLTLSNLTDNMVLVEGGTFIMGATLEQLDPWVDEKPKHKVTLSSYYICKYEVTQELWKAVMGSNPSKFKNNDYPVEHVSWDDCQEFIKKLNSMTGKKFRLPTEAEWEYAARGGKHRSGFILSGSSKINDVAWYKDNSGDKPHTVGTKAPNGLGIYDMSGNVWEWCQDWYGKYDVIDQTNPSGPCKGSCRVMRGGCWDGSSWYCRVSMRCLHNPDGRRHNIGLRLALTHL